MSIKKLGFLIKSIAILVVEYIKFLVTRNQMSMVQNIAQQLAKENIFYVKIFQSLSSNNEFFTDESTEFLTQYTDRAPYTSSEINTSFIKTIGFSALSGIFLLAARTIVSPLQPRTKEVCRRDMPVCFQATPAMTPVSRVAA